MSDEPGRPRHVVVLGAGPAGLATAHELSRFGVRVTVLEQNDFVGGLCRTVDYKGYRFDLGGHRWFSKNPDLNNWFKRLMAGELVDVERTSRIFHDGTFYQYPVNFGDVMRKTRFATLAHAFASYTAALVKYRLLGHRIRHIRDAFTAQFGAKLFNMFFRHYTEKVWGKPCEQLSADWVSQRSKGLSVWALVKEILSSRRSSNESLIEQFMYPQYGYMRISERMAEDIRAAGNTIELSGRVRAIEYRGANDFCVRYDDAGGARSIEVSDVVSTIPLGPMARMIEPGCPEAVTQAAAALEFRDLITVNLVVRRSQVSSDTWLYVQNRDILFGRLHEPKNWSASMVPDSDHTSLVLECFCFRSDDIWQQSDDTIAKRCIDDLAEQLGFVKVEDVVDWCVVRTTNAYPIYDLEYADKIATIRGFIDPLEGLHIAGRGGTFRYNNADHSIEMGLVLAHEIAGFGGDHLAVNTDRGYQEIATEADRERRAARTRAAAQARAS